MRKFLSFILFFILVSKTSFGQEKKTILVQGVGKTCNEAKQDALRNAINQSYGSLLYSKTEVKNDVLISDNIDMLTSGNILEYKIIEDCKVNVGEFTVKLNVIVSQTELKKFIDGKGKSVSISGELIKQKTIQEINSKSSELNIIRNLLFSLETQAYELFDYEISMGKVTIKNGICDLPADVTIKSNKNLTNIFLKLTKELEFLSINSIDIEFRKETLNETSYKLDINSNSYYLRNNESVELIRDFYSTLISKIDDYAIVDGCLSDLNLIEKTKNVYLNKNVILFPEVGFVTKTINGSFTKTINDIASLDRINIFPKNKLIEYKNGKSMKGELELMNYSETNPLEVLEIKRNLISTFDNLSKESEDGFIDLKYVISFSNDGMNKSYLDKIKTSQSKYKINIGNSISQVNLNPSRLCGTFIKTNEDIIFNFKWDTYKNNYIYSKTSKSDYNQFFIDQKLQFGNYVLTIKERELNSNKYKDVFISNYKTRGPLTSLYSMLLPGWGTRRITYNENNGWKRFSLVVTPLLLSASSVFISDIFYKKYQNSTHQVDIDKNYKIANLSNKASYFFLGFSALFYIYDVTWVFGKGVKNIIHKKEIKDKIKNSGFQIQTEKIY
jgi:hypothetical protein